jgi:C4-dicarboxylate-specific signal transduction histidine kinase
MLGTRFVVTACVCLLVVTLLWLLYSIASRKRTDITKQVRADEELQFGEQRYRTLFEQAQRTQDMLADNERRYRQLFEYAPVALAQTSAGRRVAMVKQLHDQGITDLRAYFDQNPDALHRIMGGSTIENVNRRMVEMFGARDASELLGTTTRWLWRRSPEMFLRGLESRLRGELIFQGEMEVETLDGRIINVVFTLARPEILTVLGVNFVGFVDVTNQVRATAMLQKLQADFAHAARVSMLGELTASIAHEINQPLAAIIVAGEAAQRWLNRAKPDIAKAGQSLQRIVNAATRSGDIISRIRSMAMGQAPQYTQISLNEVIGEAIKFLDHQIKLSNVDVSLDLTPTLPLLDGDQVQLQQVAVNLIMNAIQAMDRANIRRPAIAIRTAGGENDTIRCSFEDSGNGVEAQHFERLFNSFFTTKDSGMGMGLPVSRAIVEAHGGKLTADNKSVLGGARFVVMLPGRATAEDPAAVDGSAAQRINARTTGHP